MDTTEDQDNKIQQEKMKRMSIAVKGVGGWFSYFIGWATLIVGTLNIYVQFKQIDYFITFLGLPILIGGLYLLYSHVKAKNFTGKIKIVKLIKVFGGLIIIPGLLGLLTLHKDYYYYNYFVTAMGIGAGFIFASIILKKAWGIKTEKRKKVIETV